ncbi:hypothetical protein [Methanobacterium petrolearium]|uniref:hypothetical protein n=1 Tax=Methanobacterium petrolearium TaxID=710190 RepID=UPI003081BAE2
MVFGVTAAFLGFSTFLGSVLSFLMVGVMVFEGPNFGCSSAFRLGLITLDLDSSREIEGFFL